MTSRRVRVEVSSIAKKKLGIDDGGNPVQKETKKFVNGMRDCSRVSLGLQVILGFELGIVRDCPGAPGNIGFRLSCVRFVV